MKVDISARCVQVVGLHAMRYYTDMTLCFLLGSEEDGKCLLKNAVPVGHCHPASPMLIDIANALVSEYAKEKGMAIVGLAVAPEVHESGAVPMMAPKIAESLNLNCIVSVGQIKAEAGVEAFKVGNSLSSFVRCGFTPRRSLSAPASCFVSPLLTEYEGLREEEHHFEGSGICGI